MKLENKENIYGYHQNKKIPYLKITVALQKLIAPTRRLLEGGAFTCPGYSMKGYRTFESNIDFEVLLYVCCGTTQIYCIVHVVKLSNTFQSDQLGFDHEKLF